MKSPDFLPSLTQELSICRLPIILLGLLSLASCTNPPDRHFNSKNFDGKVFRNINGREKPHDFLDIIKWRFFTDRKPWPQKVPVKPQKVYTRKNPYGDLSATFINHSTVLIQVDGVNILTDPIWSERCSPVSWVGPKRVRRPGIRFRDLPPIDIVLISHNHYDHFDLPTLERLSKIHEPLFIAGLGHEKQFKSILSQSYKELDWGDSTSHHNIEIFFEPSQHWSRRSLFDTNKSLWGSFVIKSSDHLIYFAGDTGYADHFKEAYKKFGPFDLSLLPIGAYEPRWFMKFAHMNPEEAVQAHIDLRSKKSLGIHFGTFQLTNEGIDDPIADTKNALKKLEIKSKNFVIPTQGQSILVK